MSFPANRTHARNVPSPQWSLTSLSRGLQGGGVLVEGEANFEGCNIHDNNAFYVCLQLELSLNFPPLPLWSLTSLSRGSQGGGVYVDYNGVANFEACGIHDNSASWVCLHLELSLIELSSIAPLN